MTAPDLTALAAEDARLADTAEQIAERRAEIRALFLQYLPVSEPQQLGEHVVTVKAGSRRIDATLLAKAYPVARFPHFYKPAIDTAAVKKHLAPAELDAYKKDSAPTVQVQDALPLEAGA